MMKIFSFLVLLVCLQVSTRSIAQTVSYTGRNVSVQKVLDDLKKQTGFVFFYDLDILEKTKPVTVDVKNVSLEEMLKKVLGGQGLKFVVQGKSVVISRGRKIKEDTVKKREIKGRVMNEKSEPLTGATVVVKGSDIMTLTGPEGYFILKGIRGEEAIVITNIGYEQKTMRLTDDNNIEIRLSVLAQSIKEVVVRGNTGYQVIDKDHPGSFDVVDNKLLNL